VLVLSQLVGTRSWRSFFLLTCIAQVYEPNDVLRAKYEIAKKTNMADFAIGLFRELHGEAAVVPAGKFVRTIVPARGGR
jgi:hypothetical protein